MLRIHLSNRYETLAELLLQQLQASSGDVFVADEVVVPGAAVRRSVTLTRAGRDGVCANVAFSFLARWLWQQVAKVVPGTPSQSPFEASALAWRIYGILGDQGFVAAHPRLAAYLGSADAVMRYELAARTAGLLEQYITYRPDWLEAWQDGDAGELKGFEGVAAEDARWQAGLWQRITHDLGLSAVHPITSLIAALEHGGANLARTAGLPHAAHVFALPSIAPLHLQALQQLGRWIDIHVYALNPCQEYWFELVDAKRLTALQVRGKAQAHEVGNPLLSAWGRQAQSHLAMLLEASGDAVQEESHYERAGGETLLAAVQNAILDLGELAPGSVHMADGDRSIEVHVCHSMTRELEVLHDHLLGLFASDSGLQPSDVLVVTPGLEAAAPLIEAVLGTAPPERRIPFAITGRPRASVIAPARALMGLLALAGSRFTVSDVYGLLQQAVVARRFGLDDAALQTVHEWMLAAGVHWGLDADHLHGLGLPVAARHTLLDGLDRLMLGYALPSDVGEPLLGMLPRGDAEGSEAVALGAFAAFAEALRALRGTAAVSRPPVAWVGWLHELLEAFVQADGQEMEDLAEVHRAINALAESMQAGGLQDPLPLTVVRSALAQALDGAGAGAVPGGMVTFAPMSGLRNLPYEVVCAIGLNDGSFPVQDRPSEFDLMARMPRAGDRQRRDDQRNLFLDLLLAARRSLYISYAGRSVRDNASMPPSVLVADLLDVVVPAVSDEPSSPESVARARSRLVVEHPLQPFSPDAFSRDGDERLRSFDGDLAKALRESLDRQAKPSDAAVVEGEPAEDEVEDGPTLEVVTRFFGDPLEQPSAEWREVSLERLIEFFKNPCRYLLRHRMAIALPWREDTLEDDEPFLPDIPSRSALARRLLPTLLAGEDIGLVRSLARAGTEMPPGALGDGVLERELIAMSQFAGRVREASAEPVSAPRQFTIDVDLDGENWRLAATFSDLRRDGLVRWRYDDERAGDVLEAWLHHLVLCASAATGVEPVTRWICRDETRTLSPRGDAQDQLRELLRLYRRGLSEPLLFFSKAAWAYVKDGENNIYRAQHVWQATRDRPFGEEADPAYRLALRGIADPLGDEFQQLAIAVFGPILQHETAEA